MQQLSAIDLFSGPGGLTLGMTRAGLVPVAGVERNRDACLTYKRHTPDSEHHCADVRDVDFRRCMQGPIDVVYGGPPCQPFSYGGVRKAHQDDRDMIPAFLAVVDAVQPAALLIENVPGLLTKATKPYFTAVVVMLEKLGYRTTWKELHSADYGVPQKRRRLFIVGMRDQFFPSLGRLTALMRRSLMPFPAAP